MMYSLITQASEEVSRSIAGNIGYALGYLVGSFSYEILSGLLLIIGVFLYLVVFRKKPRAGN